MEKKEKKDCRFSFRCTAFEKEKIAEIAESCGLSTSKYIMLRSLGCEPKKAMSDKEKILYNGIWDIRRDLKNFQTALKMKTKDYTPEARLAYKLWGASYGEWMEALERVIHDMEIIIQKHQK